MQHLIRHEPYRASRSCYAIAHIWEPRKKMSKAVNILPATHGQQRNASLPSVREATEMPTPPSAPRTCNLRCLITSRRGTCTLPLKWLIML